MRERLTYANVTATIALFLALGLGGAYAASKITKKDIAKDAVTAKAIKKKAVRSVEIKDRAVAAADLAPGQAFTPTLGTGGENDCIWFDVAGPDPDTAPIRVFENPLGEVAMTGITSADDGPGGDAACGGVGEVAEDLTVFTLPAGLTPAITESFILPSDVGVVAVIVAGVNGTDLGGGNLLPAGSVLFTNADELAYLNYVHFLAADSPSSPAPLSAARPDRIDRTARQALAG